MLTEKTIGQILGVLELTSKNYQNGLPISKAYQKSVKEIAHKYSIHYQTIADGCGRRLGLDSVQFIELIGGWLGGRSQKLRDLLVENANALDGYKINEFFERQLPLSAQPAIERSVESKVETVTFKLAQNIFLQFRSLAEKEGKSVELLSGCIIKDYVDKNYVEYLKQVINSLSESDKEKVLVELAKNRGMTL